MKKSLLLLALSLPLTSSADNIPPRVRFDFRDLVQPIIEIPYTPPAPRKIGELMPSWTLRWWENSVDTPLYDEKGKKIGRIFGKLERNSEFPKYIFFQRYCDGGYEKEISVVNDNLSKVKYTDYDGDGFVDSVWKSSVWEIKEDISYATFSNEDISYATFYIPFKKCEEEKALMSSELGGE